MTRLNPGKLAIARGLIRRGFSQRAFARTKRGREIGPKERPAARFCAIGALLRIGYYAAATEALNEKASELFGVSNIVALNDGPNGQAKVLAVYDALIKEHSA